VERQRFSRWREYSVTPVLEFFLYCFPAVMLCTQVPVPNIFKFGLFFTAEIERTRQFPPGSAKRIETHTCYMLSKHVKMWERQRLFRFSTMSAHMCAKRRAQRRNAQPARQHQYISHVRAGSTFTASSQLHQLLCRFWFGFRSAIESDHG
jgi:hypothetical protein